MTWVDGVILAVLAISAVLAFMRGLVQEVLGIAAWIGAIFAALAFRPRTAAFLGQWINPPWLADAIGAAAVFLIVLILLRIVIAWVSGRVQDSVLGGTDRALGLVFGLARGAFLVVAAYIVAGMVLPGTDRWPEPVRQARFLPLVSSGADWLVARLPADLQPRVLTPPAQLAPTLEELLRPPARDRT